MMLRSSICCALLVLLAACGSDPAPAPTDDGRQGAEGEVLGGTISDEMLPLDTLRSQSPPQRGLAQGSEAETGPGDEAAATDTPPAEDQDAPVDETQEDVGGE